MSILDFCKNEGSFADPGGEWGRYLE